MKKIKWPKDKATQEIISKIAEKAVKMAREHEIQYDQQTAMMDISACHKNGNPLRLTDLLNADDFNFVHDIFGIRANLNRETGKLENCFVPRYSIR